MSSQHADNTTAHNAKADVDQARHDVAAAADHTRRAAEKAGAQMKQAAGGLADKAKDAATAQAREAKSAGAHSAERVADELERAAANCGDSDAWAQKLLSEGASSLRTASQYLSGHRIEDLLRDGEDFARKNPAAYLGASIAAGFLLARVGKTATARATGESQDRNRNPNQDRSNGSHNGNGGLFENE